MPNMICRVSSLIWKVSNLKWKWSHQLRQPRMCKWRSFRWRACLGMRTNNVIKNQLLPAATSSSLPHTINDHLVQIFGSLNKLRGMEWQPIDGIQLLLTAGGSCSTWGGWNCYYSAQLELDQGRQIRAENVLSSTDFLKRFHTDGCSSTMRRITGSCPFLCKVQNQQCTLSILLWTTAMVVLEQNLRPMKENELPLW